MADRTLLAEIEAGALDSSVEIADVLRRCIALGGQSGSVQLRDWATLELKGYRDDAPVPDYRLLSGPLFADGINPGLHYQHQPISRSLVPAEVRSSVPEELSIRDPIAQVAATARNARDRDKGIRLSMGHFPDIAGMISRQNWPEQITELYYDLTAASFEGIVDAVRTVVVELTAEIRAGLPAGVEAPSGQLADRAVEIAVRGDNNRIQIASAPQAAVTASSIESSPDASIETPIATGDTTTAEERDLMWWLIGIATIIAALAGIWALFIR